MSFDQKVEYTDNSQYLRNCDSSNAYEISGQIASDHFYTLYNQASEKQQRISQKQDELNEEIKQKANKIKIDQHSQKILLKKLENQINNALNKNAIDEQLDYDRFSQTLIDLGIANKNDHVTLDLWKLLTLGIELETAFVGFVFNILVILLEKQLTQTQSFYLLTDVINAELEDQGIPAQVLNFEEINEIMTRLVHKFKLLNVRTSHGSRNHSSSKKESQQKDSYKPIVNNKQKQIDSETLCRYEILYEHSKVLQEKKRQLESQIQDDPECFFKPQLTAVQTKRQDCVNTSNTFTRLYQNAEAIKLHKQKLKENLEKQKQEEELQECTFKPKLTHQSKYAYKPVKGESAIIERMNKARQMKQEKENFYTVEHNNSSNQQRPHQTVPEPFGLSSKTANQRQMLLNVDIKISKNRKARICLREGDDINQVIKGFAKAHQLNQDQQNVLRETLEQYIN